MPLRAGRSRKVISENIAELLRTYKEKGTIGNIRPKSKAHAQRIAAAIAYRSARASTPAAKRSRRQTRRKHEAE